MKRRLLLTRDEREGIRRGEADIRHLESIKRKRGLTHEEQLVLGAFLMSRFFLRGGRGPIPKDAHAFLDAMQDWLKATKDPRLFIHPDGEIEVAHLPDAVCDFTHYKAMEEQMAADKAYRA